MSQLLDAINGSIPACAGEPPSHPSTDLRIKVYPRVCGGTKLSAGKLNADAGLSPRVRGNRAPRGSAGFARGSIPACAGEPICDISTHGPSKVYPRVCGGTISTSSGAHTTTGLSPRVRGNLGNPLLAGRHSGSIPACAGEPTDKGDLDKGYRVYPRVCGGTGCVDRCTCDAWGLSPRVRGNRGRA